MTNWQSGYHPKFYQNGKSIISDMIKQEEEEYVEKAVALASDTKKLASIRETLRDKMEASPIMDQKGFARELEEAYQAMWKKWCST